MQTSSYNPFRRWVIWFLPTFYMFYQYGIQALPSIKIQYIESHYVVGDLRVALLNTAYLLPYVLLQLPAGVLIDHYDVRKILTASISLFGIGTIFIWLSNLKDIYLLYVLGHLCMGVAASVVFISALYLANLWLPKSVYKFAVGLTEMFTSLGVFVVVIIYSHFLIYFDWNKLIFINAMLCFTLAIVFWLLIRDTEKSNQFEVKNIFLHLKLLIKNKSIWLCALYVGCGFAHIIVLTNTWRINFLESHYHLSLYTATVTNGYTIFGYIVGAPIFGLLGGKSNRIGWLITIAACFECILLLISIFFVENLDTNTWVYLLLGFFTGAIPLGFALIADLVDESILATGVGFVNMLEITLGMILTPIVGELLNLSQGNYKMAVTPVIVVTFMTPIIAFWLARRIKSSLAP